MYAVKAAQRPRVQREDFSMKLTVGLQKCGCRLVREIICGIQARGSVELSEIARALGERTALKKDVERLGRQLGRPCLRQHVRENLLREAVGFVSRDTLQVVDATDLSKPCARKMKYLAEVRDESDKTLGPGYWSMTVVAAPPPAARRRSPPLLGTLLSGAAQLRQRESEDTRPNRQRRPDDQGARDLAGGPGWRLALDLSAPAGRRVSLHHPAVGETASCWPAVNPALPSRSLPAALPGDHRPSGVGWRADLVLAVRCPGRVLSRAAGPVPLPSGDRGLRRTTPGPADH